MASVSTSFKLKSFFGRIPTTESIEKKQAELKSEYDWLQEFEQSEFLHDFLALEKKVNSPDFQKKIDEVKNDTFDKTKEYRQLKEFQKLQKNKVIKKALKYINSGVPAEVEEIGASEAWKQFSDLQKKVESLNFQTRKKELETLKKWDESDEKKAYDQYIDLKNNESIKKYVKVTASGKYKKYQQAIKSADYLKFVELGKIVESEEFKKVKAEKEDTERYKKTEEYKELQRYEELKKSDDMVHYYNLKKSEKFHELKKWELVFEDNFDKKELDTDKWITHYYWGKALLNEGYSLASDKHFPTDGKNLEIKNSVLKIITRKEKFNGKVWDPRLGFYPKDFDYTSGLISTGTSFRQKYGRFEAKIRINSNTPVTNAFWMVSDIMLPQIDVIKTTGHNKLSVANHWGPQIKSNVAKFNGSRFGNQFFIFSLEWEKGKLRWKVNDTVIREETNGVPDAPMYMVFSSGLSTEVNDTQLPASFEIDWVRCYKKKD